MNKTLLFLCKIVLLNVFLLFTYSVNAQITITHNNSGYINSEQVIEWRINGGTIDPTDSNFDLLRDGSSKGHNDLEIIEITPNQDYIVRVDLNDIGGNNEGDVFTLEYDNGSTYLSVKSYILDYTDPNFTSLELSSSSESGLDLNDRITNIENVSFDLVAEVGVTYLLKDAFDNEIASGVSTGSNTIVTSLTEGVHDLTLVLSDLAENTFTQAISITIDTTDPLLIPNEPVIELVDKSGVYTTIFTNIGDPTFNISNLDLTAGNRLILVSDLEGGEIGSIDLTSNDPEQVTSNLTVEGKHLITAIVTDIAGNEVSSTALEVNFDNTAPDTPIISLQSASNSGRDDTDIYSNVDQPIFDISNIETGVKLELLKESGTNPPTVVDFTSEIMTMTDTSIISSLLTVDDIFYYQIKLTDKAGNSDVTSLSNIIEYDYKQSHTLTQTVSNLSINNNPSSPTSNYISNKDVDLLFEGLIDNVNNELIITDNLDNEITRIVVDETEELITLVDLVDDNYTIKYYIEDIYGNQNATASFNFTVDTEAPVISNLSFSSNNITNTKLLTESFNEFTIQFEVNETLIDTEDPSVKVDNNTQIVNEDSPNSYSSTDNFTVVNFKEVILEVIVKDFAGNSTTITSPNDVESLFTYPELVNTIKPQTDIEFCDTNNQIELVSDQTVQGGNGSYEYNWYLDNVELGIVNENLSYYQNLSIGTHEFKRVITSFGEEVSSNVIQVEINPPYVNTIDNLSTDVYFGQIDNSDISFSSNPSTGGDGTFKYQWQFYNGSIWIDKDATDAYIHDEIINVPGNYKFRRIVTSLTDKCETISNEVSVTLLPQVINNITVTASPNPESFCIGDTNFEIESVALSGGDDVYNITWERERNNEGFIEITGETNPNYIETEELLSGTYKYKRLVTSGGSNVVQSNIYTIQVNDNISGNEIELASTSEYFGSISISDITINEKTSPSGGGGNYSYKWEMFDGTNWVNTSVTNSNFSNLSSITTKGTYLFRRVVTSTTCSNHISNEITINLYEEINNNNLSLIDGNEFCINNDLFILGSNPTGGTGSYTYQWFRKLSSETDVDYINIGETDPYLYISNLSTAGNYDFKRKVISGSSFNEEVISIKVIPKPSVSLSPTTGSNFSNSSSIGITLDIGLSNDFYCTGTGVVSNGSGSVNNKFYPNLAGIGTHEIEYHVTTGSCEYTFTNSIIVYDGQKPFISINETYCEESSNINVKFDPLNKASDDINEPTTYMNSYTFDRFEVYDSKNNFISGFLDKNLSLDLSTVLQRTGTTSENLIFKARYISQVSPLKYAYLQQELTITYTPEIPEVINENPNYCNDLNGLSPLRVTNNIGTVKWYDSNNDLVYTGRDYQPIIDPIDVLTDSDNKFIYYVTQTVNGCESDTKEVVIDVFKETPIPTFDNNLVTLCEGDEIPELSVLTGSNVIWYDKDGNELSNSDTFKPNISTTGFALNENIKKYTFKVTSTENFCESDFATIEIEVLKRPNIPEQLGSNLLYCNGETNFQPLKIKPAAPGNTFEWYSDVNLTSSLSETSDEFEITSIPEATTNEVVVNYWVVQINSNGCTSEPLQINYTVYPLPSEPELSTSDNLSICSGDNELWMTAINFDGSIFWYNDRPEDNGYTQVDMYEGASYQPTYNTNVAVDTEIDFYVAEKSINNCFGPSKKVTIKINALPEIPTLVTDNSNLTICSGEIFPEVEVSGLNVKWYEDSNLTSLLFTGNIYDPKVNYDVANDSMVTYYAVATTIEGCVSEKLEVNINIKALPDLPIAETVPDYCEDAPISPLVVNGEAGSTFTWYSNEQLTKVVSSQQTFDPGINAPSFAQIDSLFYWVTQTSIDGCISDPQKVSIPVHPTPVGPDLTQTVFEYCNGQTIMPIDAIGNKVEWYLDSDLKNQFSTGKTLNPVQPNNTNEDYHATYYVIQKNSIDCFSDPVEVNITVYKKTLAPIIPQTQFEYCKNDVLQPISVVGGKQITWYSDSGLQDTVATGNSFLPTDNTDVDSDVIINYYYTENVNNCPSDPVTISIIINKTPSQPLINGGTELDLCSGEEIQTLIVVNQTENLRWYSDERLTDLIYEGNNFTPNINTNTTSEINIDYYVTSTHNDCESEATNFTIRLHALPIIELVGIEENEIFCKSELINPRVVVNQTNGTLVSPTGAILNGENQILLGTSPVGDHLLKYTYTNEYGCVDSVSRAFTIVDVPKVGFTHSVNCNEKIITVNDTTKILDTDNFTEILEWRYDFGDGTLVTLYSAAEAVSYSHTYETRGFKTIKLTIVTNQNCNEIDFEKTIFINNPPEADFNWKISELGKAMIFESITEEEDGDMIVGHYWDFGDGTNSTELNPQKIFDNVGEKTVTYKIITDKGCESSIVKKVFVIPHPVITEFNPYQENFDISGGDWIATSIDSTKNSWERGIATTSNFNVNNNAWVTRLDSMYFESEESYLNLPSFDISNLSKPMLSFDMLIDLEEGIDGLILQYTTDYGETWKLLGTVNDPINWYNNRNILSDPGTQIVGNVTESLGWTGTFKTFESDSLEYISVRHQLDEFIGEEHFRLRFAFKSNSAIEREGVLIDNFFIGNREKVVLIESMTNTDIEGSNRSMSTLDDHLLTMTSDVLAINYHIQLEGVFDPFNSDNPEPASGRKFYYGITNAPRTVIDGNSFQGHTDDFVDDFQNNVYSRTLLDSKFDIDIDLSETIETGMLGVTITSNDIFNRDSSEIVIHAVTIEKEINDMVTNEFISRHINVMKSMSPAPGSEGTSYFGRSWSVNSSETAFIEWANTSVYDMNEVELIVFVQDNVSKEIYQAKSINVTPELLQRDIVNSIENEDVRSWNLYPNPATNNINITTNFYILNGSYEISNINGQKLKEGKFIGNKYSIDTSNLPSGVYILRNAENGKYFNEIIRFVVAK